MAKPRLALEAPMKAWAEDHGIQMFFLSLMVLVIVTTVCACGVKSSSDDDPPPSPPPATDKAWDEIKPLVQTRCGGCHNGTVHPIKFDTAAKFKGSRAKARITDGSMPPGGGLSATDKQKLLAYLGS